MDRADFMRLGFSSYVKWTLTTLSTRPLPSCGNVLVSTHLLLKAIFCLGQRSSFHTLTAQVSSVDLRRFVI
ncbi:hypothetical protein SUGI_0708100 [Cryptomeria japonica]|nr:hypothetical protein SUGI_0708100 [Cryptomeria japonica]